MISCGIESGDLESAVIFCFSFLKVFAEAKVVLGVTRSTAFYKFMKLINTCLFSHIHHYFFIISCIYLMSTCISCIREFEKDAFS